MTKTIARMSDIEVLEAAGDFGPAVIGAELFARVQRVKATNPDGRFGPAVLGDAPEPSATPKAGGSTFPKTAAAKTAKAKK